MTELTIQEVAEAVGSESDAGGLITSVSTDSRKITGRCLFVALEGERFDGHQFVQSAIEQGAAAALVHKGEYDKSLPVIRVKNTGKALMALAAYYRSLFSVPVVGVTGSVGKTTTKDMTAAVLSARYKTIKTQGNLNNEIGLPMTVFSFDKDTQAAVIEMGMSNLGEIEALSKVAQPDIAIISNIGVSHLQTLKTRENILKAKLEILSGMKKGSPVLLNGDNDLLVTVKNPDFKIYLYGIENPNVDFKAENIEERGTCTTFTVVYKEFRVPVTLPTIGVHNVLNALAAFGAGQLLGVPAEECAKALEGYAPSGMRQKIVDFHGITIIEDCYNASPDSMRAALTTLAGMKAGGRRFAVLADMLELGDISERSHFEIGKLAGDLKIDVLYCYGNMARFIVQGAKQSGMKKCRIFEDKQELAEELKEELKPSDAVLFKGSRGMMLEDIINDLYGEECGK